MGQSNSPNAAEAAATETILDIDLNRQAQNGSDLRNDHAKSHGLVWGEFSVENNIPELLKVGVFAQSKTYPVWVRFSSAAPVQKRGKLSSDLEPDARGMVVLQKVFKGRAILTISSRYAATWKI